MTRVLLLRDPVTAGALEWKELERRLPGAERVGHRRAAALCLEEGPYDLIVADAVLPDGGPYGLLGTLIGRHHPTTVVIHFRLQGGERWLKLFEEGEFDLQAEPMSSARFFEWLDNWFAARGPDLAAAKECAHAHQ